MISKHGFTDITWRVYPREGKPVLLGVVRAASAEVALKKAQENHWHQKFAAPDVLKGDYRVEL